MSEVVVAAESRTELGGRAAKRMRRAGRVPAVLYGRNQETVTLSVGERELNTALHTEAGFNAIINLEMGGERQPTLAREIQRHPVRSDIVHLDFIRISLSEAVEAEVAIETTGTPVGVRESGGIIEHLRNEVLVRALPTNIPNQILADISALDIGDVLRVRDLPELPGVLYLDEPVTGLVAVIIPRAVVVEEVAPVVTEAVEGAEAPAAEEAETTES